MFDRSPPGGVTPRWGRAERRSEDGPPELLLHPAGLVRLWIWGETVRCGRYIDGGGGMKGGQRGKHGGDSRWGGGESSQLFFFRPFNSAAHRLQPAALAALPLQQAAFKSPLSNFHTCPEVPRSQRLSHQFSPPPVLGPPSLQAEPVLIERSWKRRLLTNYKPNGWLSLTLRPLWPPEVGKTFWPINVTAIGKHLDPLLPRMTNEKRLIRWFANLNMRAATDAG